jgi:hypothetical protein
VFGFGGHNFLRPRSDFLAIIIIIIRLQFFISVNDIFRVKNCSNNNWYYYLPSASIPKDEEQQRKCRKEFPGVLRLFYGFFQTVAKRVGKPHSIKALCGDRTALADEVCVHVGLRLRP